MTMDTQFYYTKLLSVYDQALNSVKGEACVEKSLQKQVDINGTTSVISIGKAAQSMAQGAFKALKGNIHKGLIVTKQGHIKPEQVPDNFEYFESSHPIPSKSSLEAGQKILSFVAEISASSTLLVLISGGASALVDVLVEGLTLDNLQSINRWMLSAGLAIDEMNAIRSRMSLIKSGRLLKHVQHLNVINLVLSDVPGDDVSVIGSGLLISNHYRLPNFKNYPAAIRKIINTAGRQRTDSYKAQSIKIEVVASNSDLCLEIKKLAQREGFNTAVIRQVLQGNTVKMAKEISAFLKTAQPGCYIWGGETTLCLPVKPGRGGRNQHLALVAAKYLSTTSNVILLAIGTDGTDGPTEDAGALIDGETRLRGENEGYNIDDCLQAADSGSFLQASGDLISTGPTGTNVMDVVIGLKWL